MQLSVIILTVTFSLALEQTASYPQYPFYNPYPQYFTPYIGNYGYNRPQYFPSYNQNPYMYQQNLANNPVGDADIIDVDNRDSTTNEYVQNWLKNYQQNIQQYNQEQLNNQAKENQKQIVEKWEQQKKQLEEAARQQQQKTLEIVTTKPSNENNYNTKDIVKLADGSGYVLKQNSQSFHETITSKPIVHSYTETKPIISHIHRVFSGDGSHPMIKVFYNGKDITDDQDVVNAMPNKHSTTESNTLKPSAVVSTTEENSDASDEDDDDDNNSAPKPITSWFG